MGRIWMPGGAGGADLDVVTAAAGDVLQGKVIVGQDGEPLTGTLALTGNAADSQVLAGKTYYNTDAKARRTGTMPNQGAVAPSGLNAGGSYTIPAGYHNGSGKVTANSLASQTGVQSGKTAAGAGQVLTGYEAWVNGGRVTGTMPNQGAQTAGVNCGGTYTIPAGYHNGQGKVTGNSLASQTDATSSVGDILSGKTAWVKGSKITGTMANKGAVTGSVSCGGSYTIPAGYHNGSGKVTGNSLASQTGVQSGKTAAGAGQVLTGYEAWVNGNRVTGTMANQGAKTSSLNCGGSYTIPAGYHNGSGKVTANSLASQTDSTAAAGDILSGKTAWVKGSKLTGTLATMAGQTITPSTSQQTVSCSGKKMTGNVVVNAIPSGYQRYISVNSGFGSIMKADFPANKEITLTKSVEALPRSVIIQPYFNNAEVLSRPCLVFESLTKNVYIDIADQNTYTGTYFRLYISCSFNISECKITITNKAGRTPANNLKVTLVGYFV